MFLIVASQPLTFIAGNWFVYSAPGRGPLRALRAH